MLYELYRTLSYDVNIKQSILLLKPSGVKLTPDLTYTLHRFFTQKYHTACSGSVHWNKFLEHTCVALIR